MTSITAAEPSSSSAVKALHKRYEGLLTVRTKAVKGKGAWYWAHLEPILLRHPSSDLPKAVKLRCSLCAALFSASNPSRTATEHLKRAACPNISSAVASPLPISSFPSPPTTGAAAAAAAATKRPFSGGSDDLCALAMFENSVKRLRTPELSPPPPVLSRDQINSAVDLLSDWFHESCGSVSLSCLSSPKFRAFLARVGLPPISKLDFFGPRLDARFDEAKADSDARINDAPFFQLAAAGWKLAGEDGLVSFTVNLPNRSSVFRRAVFAVGEVSSSHAEEIILSATEESCGGERCVGIVSDRFKSKALRSIEDRNQWMVNLPCQFKGISSLIKDFSREFPLFKNVADNCAKVSSFLSSEPRLRRAFPLLRSAPALSAVEDLLGSSRAIRAAVVDESCDAARMVQSSRFWDELQAVYSLTKVVKSMSEEIEVERPLVGQCLPLWDDLRRRVKEWRAKCGVVDSSAVEKIVESRFRRVYHPAMSAAFILDPQNLVRDNSGKYLPPFNCLTQEQEKDVDRLVTRLVSREEAHIALMELMKWRSEGLDPLYAQAVQVKQRDPVTGKMKIANPQSSRLVWETCLSEFKTLGKVAVRLVFLEATACGFKCNWSFMKWICVHKHSRVGLERAQKMLFVAAHAKLERRDDLSTEEERDAAELFADDDILGGEVFADAHSVEDLVELVGG